MKPGTIFKTLSLAVVFAVAAAFLLGGDLQSAKAAGGVSRRRCSAPCLDQKGLRAFREGCSWCNPPLKLVNIAMTPI